MIICPKISEGSKFLILPHNVEAQNLHPIGQPTSVEMQIEYPYWYFKTTLSIISPSDNSKRYFTVSSIFETYFSLIIGSFISN